MDSISIPPRPVALGLVVFASWTLLLSVAGQAYILFTSSSAITSDYLYVNSWDMIGILVAVLSVVAASWLVTLALPKQIRLGAEMSSPMLDARVDDKRALKIEVKEERDARVKAAQATYIPYFIAGNVCVGLWSILFILEFHVASQLALLANLIIQNFAIFIALHNWRNPELRMSRDTWRMHILSKGNAALAVLFLWTNSGILESFSSPTLPEMLNNGTIFILMVVGGGPDPTLGLFLLYDLIALAYGTGAVEEWQVAFQYTSLLVIFVLAWDISSLAMLSSGATVEDTSKDVRVQYVD